MHPRKGKRWREHLLDGKMFFSRTKKQKDSPKREKRKNVTRVQGKKQKKLSYHAFIIYPVGTGTLALNTVL